MFNFLQRQTPAPLVFFHIPKTAGTTFRNIIVDAYPARAIYKLSGLNIEKDMLYKYGVRVNTDILLDEECGPVYVPFLDNVFPWYFSPRLQPQKHVITSNLDPIRGNYASTLDPVNTSDTAVTKTVLLASNKERFAFSVAISSA